MFFKVSINFIAGSGKKRAFSMMQLKKMDENRVRRFRARVTLKAPFQNGVPNSVKFSDTKSCYTPFEPQWPLDYFIIKHSYRYLYCIRRYMLFYVHRKKNWKKLKIFSFFKHPYLRTLKTFDEFSNFPKKLSFSAFHCCL